MKKYYTAEIKAKMKRNGYPYCIMGKNGPYHCKSCINIFKKRIKISKTYI